MHRSNGLVDDFVLYGIPADYLSFAERVEVAIGTGTTVTLNTSSRIHIEILKAEELSELFTSLQNEDDLYESMDAWSDRNILRVRGSTDVLDRFRRFLVDLSTRGDGYSYISEYSDGLGYCAYSPQWRLHVEEA